MIQAELQAELARRVREAVVHYADTYEAELATYPEHLHRHFLDYRERNAKLDPGKVQLFYAPFTMSQGVYFRYDDLFGSVPWRTIVPVVVYKETAKLLMVGCDHADLDRLRLFQRGAIADPSDPVKLDELHINTDPANVFRQIPKTELGVTIFRTAQEAFDSLPEANKITEAELVRQLAALEKARDAKRLEDDKARRAQPCARCNEPIGLARAYARHLGYGTENKALQFVHLDCRKCEICGEVITGEYVYTYVTQDTQPLRTGWVTIDSGPTRVDILYYHAACAFRAGINPDNGGRRIAEDEVTP